MAKSKYGDKYSCFKCGVKFYTMGKPEAVCPKCGVDQKGAPKRAGSRAPAPKPTVTTIEFDTEEETSADGDMEFPVKETNDEDFDPKSDRMSIDGVPDQDF